MKLSALYNLDGCWPDGPDIHRPGAENWPDDALLGSIEVGTGPNGAVYVGFSIFKNNQRVGYDAFGFGALSRDERDAVLGARLSTMGDLYALHNGIFAKRRTRSKPPHGDNRPSISPSKRTRIITRDKHRCRTCGASLVDTEFMPLNIGHVVSVKEGRAKGMSWEELNDDANLIAQCRVCNAGQGSRSIGGIPGPAV